MELAAPEVYRALGYVVALDSQGYRPTLDELNAYAQQPDLRPARRENMFSRTVATTMAAFLSSMESEAAPSETIADHFLRLGWVTAAAGGRLALAPVGRALFHALEQQSVTPDTVVDVALQANDSTAFARVVGRIAQVGPALLVEPYFRLDVLMPIVELTGVTRVLASERTSRADRDSLKLGVERLTMERPFEVRVAGREVHDRYLIPDTGQVQFIGASLNGLGQVATAMGTMNDGSDAIRLVYEEIWQESGSFAVARRTETEPARESPAVKAPTKKAPTKKAAAKKAPTKKAAAKK